MKIVIILGHPKKGSFNHAIAETAAQVLRENGHTPILHDLYAEQFDPILPADEIPVNAKLDPTVARHCQEIKEAGGILLVHPNWWGQPPAMLKGWVDRVIRPGVGYKFSDTGEGEPIGLLKGKTALIFNTANTPDERERKVFGDPLETIWGKCVFNFCGVTNIHRKTFSVVVISSPEERKRWLTEVETMVGKYFPKQK